MAIRVRELAKEFKISSSALMKHLKDMGVSIKSPMSNIDDETEGKIRERFNAERAAVRQRELDRRNYQQKVVQTRKRNQQKLVQTKPQPTQKPQVQIRKEEKPEPTRWVEKPTQKKQTAAPQRERHEGRQQRQRPPRRSGSTAPERKSPSPRARSNESRPSRGSNTQNYQQSRKPSQSRDRRTYNNKDSQRPARDRTRPYKAGQKGDQRDNRPNLSRTRHKAAPPVDVISTQREIVKKEPKKKKEDFGQKNKHLKAKIKNFKRGSRKKKFVPTELEEALITKNIKKTLSSAPKKKKYRKEDKTKDTGEKRLVISEFTSVSELSKLMDVKSSEIITKFFMMGKMVTINQRLDKESLELICSEFDQEVEFAEEYGSELLHEEVEDQAVLEKVSRPPIITIMGHVDHGKTAILDHIRKTNVIAGEAGGITQHIGAYQVNYNEQKITFLDTPGHEAFTAMRARGADVTDIAVIVVAANESVKQQTVEAIDHAKAAGVTIIVAINKIDLPEANIERTINDLMQQNLYLENYGGDILWVACSAKTGEGIDELLDTILLASEMEEISVPEGVKGKGIVIESRKDSRMGTKATILVQEGQLGKGDNIVCGATYGKVRKLEDERNKELETIGASDVAILFGLNDVPKAGDIINVVENEKTARQISTERKLIRQERENYMQKTNLGNLFEKIKDAEMAVIKIIVKADTDGSVEALSDSFMKLSNEEVSLNIIRQAVGGINEADVNLASASDAIIIGFHVRASNSARKLAEDEQVEIKIYQIIYEAIEDIQKAMQGMMTPDLEEKILGNALVRQVFKIKKLGQIAGCRVEKGMITRDSLLRLFRNDIMVHEGAVSSLKHYAEDVDEIRAGTECGIGIENYNDIKEGDIIEAYRMEEVERKINFNQE